MGISEHVLQVGQTVFLRFYMFHYAKVLYVFYSLRVIFHVYAFYLHIIIWEIIIRELKSKELWLSHL